MEKTACTYTTNEEHNGIEVRFDGKPSEETRERLKAAGFRWHRQKAIWYAKNTAQTLELAKSLCAGADETPTTTEKAGGTPQNKIRIYWNGIKIDGGELIRCGYSLDNNAEHAPSITIYNHDYKDLPRDLLPVVNESDLYTDYFENDRATITPEHPLYRYFRYAAEKADDRSDRRMLKHYADKLATPERWQGDHDFAKKEIARIQKRIAARDLSNDPGQPTAEDLEEIARLNLEAENARKAAELAEEQAEREKALVEKVEGLKTITEEMDAHPLEDGAPRVIIEWSEHPAFYDWGDSSLALSLLAAENILHKLDDARVRPGYYKTAFRVEWNDEQGKSHTYAGRYDLGDGDGGLCAHIRACLSWSLSRNPDDAEMKAEAENILKLLQEELSNEKI